MSLLHRNILVVLGGWGGKMLTISAKLVITLVS